MTQQLLSPPTQSWGHTGAQPPSPPPLHSTARNGRSAPTSPPPQPPMATDRPPPPHQNSRFLSAGRAQRQASLSTSRRLGRWGGDGGGNGADPVRFRTERSAQPRTREEPPHRTAPLPRPERPRRAEPGTERLRGTPARNATDTRTRHRLQLPQRLRRTRHPITTPPITPCCCRCPFPPPPPRTPALTPRSASLCGSRSRTPPFIMGQGGASRRRPGFPPPPPARSAAVIRGGSAIPISRCWTPPPPPNIGAARTPVWNAGRRLQRDAFPPPPPLQGMR